MSLNSSQNSRFVPEPGSGGGDILRDGSGGGVMFRRLLGSGGGVVLRAVGRLVSLGRENVRIARLTNP